MIPKTIHYCWFGGGTLPEIAEACIESWARYCPGYAIVRWDETSFDVKSHQFTATAYERRMFAHVSDYVRAHALHEQGGIYLDTDVELKGSLDRFLGDRAFSGFEVPGSPFTAVWGAEPGHPWPRAVLDGYGRPVGSSEPTNTTLVTSILVDSCGIDPAVDRYQRGFEGIVIYPSSVLCLDLPENVATHHFAGSWLPNRPSVSYKDAVHARYYRDQLLASNAYDSDAEVLRDLLWNLGLRRGLRAVVGLVPLLVRVIVKRAGFGRWLPQRTEVATNEGSIRRRR